MVFEVSRVFSDLTKGMVDSRFCRNPIWVAVLITVIIMIIIPLTQGAFLWRGIFIFIASLILIFMYSTSLSRTITGAQEIEDASRILENLTYLDQDDSDDVEITPRLDVNSLQTDNGIDFESANQY